MKTSNRYQNKYSINHSQNFIHSELLSEKIIALCSIKQGDSIIEIGPGKGALTKYLIGTKANITAIEKDNTLFSYLKSLFQNETTVHFVNQDFLEYQLPLKEDLIIIGNIPFALTTAILEKVLQPKLKIKKIVIIVQKEAAQRLIGPDNKGKIESLFSLRYKPYFTTKILYRFLKTDFHPLPSVDTILLEITRKDSLDMSFFDYKGYLNFISYCFSSWKPSVNDVLKLLFSNLQRKIIQNATGINLYRKPTELSYSEWITLFQSFLEQAPLHKKKLIANAADEMAVREKELVKIFRKR